jgi:hypothetical protein
MKILDAEGALDYLLHYLSSRNGDMSILAGSSDAMKYLGANIVPLSSFGSIEIRTLRTPTTVAPLLRWLEIVNSIFENSKNFTSPMELISSLSEAPGMPLLERLLPASAVEAVARAMSREEVRRAMIQSVRAIQPFALGVDWK